MHQRLWCILRDLKSNTENPAIACCLFGQLEHKFLTTPLKGAIPLVSQSALPLCSVWCLCMNLIGNGIIKVKLGGKFIARFGANFEVDVNSSAWIPARIDSDEVSLPICICYLIPPQKFFPSGII